jgi:Ser/Thr protein kinase RdoA (MazF antagonist)
MPTTPDFPSLFLQFPLAGTFVDAVPLGNGHINDTYLVRSERPTGQVVLQRINHQVFKDPARLMANIRLVTDHLASQATKNGEDPERRTLRFLKTRDGQDVHMAQDGTFWRACCYLAGARSYESAENLDQVFNCSRAFGNFQLQMSDFSADRLFETIPGFHHTPGRLADLRAAVATDRMGRRAEVEQEIAFVEVRAHRCGLIADHLEGGRLPLRVIHNDTKFNNVMFDDSTGEALCVIDLDTVMPGSPLYDFGDSVRSGVCADELNLGLVCLDLQVFEAFVAGYLDVALGFLTPLELELMPFSAWLMTYECGMRFLSDHLDGDTYFKIRRSGHNLDRARNQFRLLLDMETKMDAMTTIVNSRIRLGS